MKNNSLIRYAKSCLYIFGMLLVLSSCEKENNIALEKSLLKTIKLNKALDFIKQTKQSKSANFITSLSDEVNYDELTNTDEMLAVIPVETTYESLYSRLTLIEIDGEIKSAVVGLHPYENATETHFSGEMLITDTEGNILKAFIIDENAIVQEFVGNNTEEKSHKHLSDKEIQEEAKNCWCGMSNCDWCGELDEVVIVADGDTNRPHVPITHLYVGIGGGGGPSQEPIPEWGYGGGANPSTNPEQEPVQEDPCDKIDEQLTNPAFLSKVDELKSKTSLTKETGYIEHSTGTFTELNETNNGHSLDLSGISMRNKNGFVHTHLNDFPTGEIDERSGLPKINEIYRIFSPADVIVFLSIAKLSSNPNNVYATVITSSGNYTLRFTGNQDDIVGVGTSIQYETIYKEYLDRYSNIERGFLNFLNDHINVDGIELYKITKPLFSSNYKVKSKTLDPDGKVKTQDCE